MSQTVKKSMFIFFCISLLMGLSGNAFAGPVSASDFIDNMSINGDLRIRYEYAEKDVPDEDPTDRWRQRFRLGMKWNNNAENWTLAAGLATGGADATSTNHTYSDTTFFETGDIRLDYAYAEHKINALKFIAGQQKNPFLTTWALWDGDVMPVGFTGQYQMAPVFVTMGGYDVRYIDRDVAYMYAVQAGAKIDFITAALGYYTYGRVDEILGKENMDKDYGYDIVDVNVASEIKMDPVTLSPYAHVFYNMGAEGVEGQSFLGGNIDPEDENMGWLIGIGAKIDKFSVSVDYAKIGADSCIAALKDGDFGNALNSVDVQGFKVGLGYKVTQNFSLAATAYLYEAAERDLDQDAKTYHFDLNYKF
jgi:hypothetical protein